MISAILFRSMRACKVWLPIIEKKDGPPDADEWTKVKDKRHLLDKGS
jgi:hypothetical protein